MNPQRIVSLAPSTTEILYALGAGERVVGVTRYCDWPPEVRQKALGIGGWLDVKDARVADLAPDLILAATSLPDRVSARLEAGGLPVLSVDPKTMDDVLETIDLIGQAVGAAVMARVLVDDIRRRMAAIAAASARRPRRPRVYVEDWHKPPTAAGYWMPELVAWAGGQSGLALRGQRSVEVTDAEVLAYDPEVIVLSWSGFGLTAQAQQIEARPGWAQVAAVRHGQIHVIDDRLLSRPGPRLLLGLRQLAAVLSAVE
jgi:iron complex transport system substrate-binding protein